MEQVMAKKKSAKKSTSSRSGGKKKSAKKKTVAGRMGDMLNSAGKGLASVAKAVTPKGMMSGRKKKKSAAKRKK
jgi:hypothetical protein